MHRIMVSPHPQDVRGVIVPPSLAGVLTEARLTSDWAACLKLLFESRKVS